MDSLVDLANQYRDELECSISELKKQATFISALTREAQTCQMLNDFRKALIRRRNEMMAVIQDTQSALPDLDTRKLMTTFSWMAVMLLGLSIGAFLGGVLLAPLVEIFISGTDAALVAYIILPIIAFYLLQLPMEISKENDLIRRHALFSFAAVEGFLTGFIFSNKDLIGIPPFAALTPTAIGIIPHFGSSMIGRDRSKLIWMTTLGGFLLHLSLGAFMDLSLPYLILAGLYAFIGFAVLQLYVNNAEKDFAMTHMYQLSFVCAVIISQALVYEIFGLDEKELAETERSSLLF